MTETTAPAIDWAAIHGRLTGSVYEPAMEPDQIPAGVHAAAQDECPDLAAIIEDRRRVLARAREAGQSWRDDVVLGELKYLHGAYAARFRAFAAEQADQMVAEAAAREDTR